MNLFKFKNMEMDVKILEEKILEEGFEIDIDEGWHKLTKSQFGGAPGRAFSELIQNAIDSYPLGTEWENRKGEIVTSRNIISITDWGEGMDLKRLSLLTTVGGTDKYGDDAKIGKFGLGFISIFNPNLGTREVTVITKCEGQTVELNFKVNDPNKRPVIKLRVLENEITFSTQITILFNNDFSVKQCIEYAEKSLKYFPCSMVIDNVLFKSIWQHKKINNALIFNENECHGIISENSIYPNVNILCKYEFIMNVSLSFFITGGRYMKYNIEDFALSETPYIENVDILLNVNNLSLTISRDSYYLDSAFYAAKRVLNNKLRYYLYLKLLNSMDLNVLVANQYILRYEVGDYINNSNAKDEKFYEEEEKKLIIILAETPVFRLNGRPGLFSLMQLKNMLNSHRPLYYSPERKNLRWLGGSFLHDFVVIPDDCKIVSSTPLLYDRLFEDVFHDVINLDTIMDNSEKIQELVYRGLVNKSALSPDCEILGVREISKEQNMFLEELNHILKNPGVLDLIEKNLQLPIKSIKSMFFFIKNEGAYLSTGLFDISGNPISEDYISNIINPDKNNAIRLNKRKVNIFLGLNLDHPFINYLIECRNPHRGYYTLTFLAHELSLCQKMLVPYSPFYYLVKEKLAQDMRKVLMKSMLKCIKN